jgi:predicted NBD/HSP70 family sugar kinase
MDDCVLVYMTFPNRHPPEAGIFINGKLFRGRKIFAGEISAIPLEIKWEAALYSSFNPLCDAIARLIVAVCSILNPDRIILNGNFLSELHMTAITKKCHTKLLSNIIPVISLSGNFIADYQSGLVVQTLEQFKPKIKLINNHREG